MVKIQINNIDEKKQTYLDTILCKVNQKVLVLLRALQHLNGQSIDFSEVHLRSLNSVTANIASIVENSTIKIGSKKKGYLDFINDYLNRDNHLNNININGLVSLCEDLIENSNANLSKLLVCEASNLIPLNNEFISRHSIENEAEMKIIKQAFDYEKFNEDISKPIRKYFRDSEFTKVCPYCNKESVIHSINNYGEVVSSHELDHFYDKSSYPLLAYSLFNLVPCDHTCNSINKRGFGMMNDFHLNPHFKGYCELIKFTPRCTTPDYKIKSIELIIIPQTNTIEYYQINGNNKIDCESGKLGNLNIFKIRSKYTSEIHRANKVLKTVANNHSFWKRIGLFLNKLQGVDMKQEYKTWYENELDVQFNPSNFNDKVYSKFYRDIHDYYYELNPHFRCNYINELMIAP